MQKPDSSWSSLLIGDFGSKELTKKLEWRNLITARLVNKAWNAIFSSDGVWKYFYENEFPSSDSAPIENYFGAFAIAYKKYTGKFI